MANGIISELTDESAISFLALQQYPVDRDVINYLNERSKDDDEFFPLVEVLTFRGGIPYKENLKVLQADNSIELVKDGLEKAHHFESFKEKKTTYRNAIIVLLSYIAKLFQLNSLHEITIEVWSSMDFP